MPPKKCAIQQAADNSVVHAALGGPCADGHDNIEHVRNGMEFGFFPLIFF